MTERIAIAAFIAFCGTHAQAIAEALAREAKMREALEWYADRFCEIGPFHEVCGKLPDDGCYGCKARAALAAIAGGTQHG